MHSVKSERKDKSQSHIICCLERDMIEGGRDERDNELLLDLHVYCVYEHILFL